MIVQFRTKVGPLDGWGNLFRLVALANFCLSRGELEAQFVVEGPEAAVVELIRQHGFSVTVLPEGVGVEDERRIQEDLPEASIIIVEMLNCTYERQSMLRRRTNKLVVFDDLLDQRFSADLVIGCQELPGYGNKSISDSHTKFLHGYEYFVFKNGYRKYCRQDRNYSDRVQRILVILGGGHYDEAYIKVARAINMLGTGRKVRFILGPAENTSLKKAIYSSLPNSEICGLDDDVYRQLWETDLAVVSGGYLKIEAALTRTPAVIIATQWHQIPLAEIFHQKSGMPYVGYKGFCTEDEIAVKLSDLMPLDARLELLKTYPSFDEFGLERVYEEVFRGVN